MADVPAALAQALGARYRLDRVVGRGGMAVVYLAEDRKHGRSVAVKVLRDDLAASLGSERFLREIEIAARLTHPHILPLYDSDDLDGHLFYVMPFVDGESLRARLRREETLDIAEALRLAGEVGSALAYAHQQGVVHRDIKPENILLSGGHAVVADFGIAKAITTAGGAGLTGTGFGLGTVGYMSPEQAAGARDVDARTDIFSLACVVFEMTVGQTLGTWPSDESVRLERFQEISAEHRAVLDRLPARIEPALVRAMAVRPEQRFPSVGEFVAAVRHPDAAGRRRFDRDEIKEIVRDAAALDAGTPTGDTGLTIGSVQRAAAEAGIEPRHVRAAAAKLAKPVPAQKVAVFGLGAKVDLEITVGHEVPVEDHFALLETVQHDLGVEGIVTPALGSGFSWASYQQGAVGESGPYTTVQVNPYRGSTRIRIAEDESKVFAMGAGVALLPLGVGAGLIANALPDMGLYIVGAWLGLTGGGFVTWARWYVRRRRRLLQGLMDRLRDVAGGAKRIEP
jgi:predicted Ser/Thr protein kinase